MAVRVRFPSFVSTDNGKEKMLEGFEGIVLIILTLISTPINTLELTPFAGFDLVEFLWRSQNSDVYGAVVEEFQSKLKEALLDENVRVSISRGSGQNDHIININIFYATDDGEKIVPIRLTESQTNKGGVDLYAYGRLITSKKSS